MHVSVRTSSMFSVLLVCIGIVVEWVISSAAVVGDTSNFAVRLNNSFGNSSNEGRLEIYYNGTWGTVCDDSFTNNSARVACASLGFAYNGTVIGNRHGAGTGRIWLDNVYCNGVESGIHRCAHNPWGVNDCTHSEDVSISCENPSNFAVRLINSFGSNPKEGRLEIFYSERWGTVCNDGFVDVSARVACASLGFGYIGRRIENRAGGTDPIWLDRVTCAGTESGLEQCAHNGWGKHKCQHDEDVTISCECGDKYFSGTSGKISSPNFPLPYANRLDCYSYIRVTSGHAIVITFLAFKTQPHRDLVTVTCESGNAFKSPYYSGLELPQVLVISSCDLVNVSFHTDSADTYTGFSLAYDITSDRVIGGLTTKPSNAFPRSDTDDAVIFNCTTAAKFLPWWTVIHNSYYYRRSYTITNSTCGVISSLPYSRGSWFMTESLGPGSCNLIIVAPADSLYLLAGSFVCIDSTLETAGAFMIPINPQLRSTKGPNSSAAVTGKIRDGERNISCNPYFAESERDLFIYISDEGETVMEIRILRTYWTSEGSVVSSTDTSNTSSYVVVKAHPNGVIPRYTCNIVCDFFSDNISDVLEIAFSTEPEVLYEAYQNLKQQVLSLGVLLGVAILTIIVILAVQLSRRCRRLNRNTGDAAGAGYESDGKEHELQQRRGESNRYEVGFGNPVDVDDSEYETMDDTRRRLPAEPAIYTRLEIKK